VTGGARHAGLARETRDCRGRRNKGEVHAECNHYGKGAMSHYEISYLKPATARQAQLTLRHKDSYT
jgi:hypothetical protein